MPALDALQSRFLAANTQVLGISVDSVHCHGGWAQSLGGIAFPLLADFNPKGAVASLYGTYLEAKGITDRATVIIDADGVVQHSSSVTPAGERNIDDLAALCESINANFGGKCAAPKAPVGLTGEATLFVKDACGFSRAVLMARDNLHLRDVVKVRNISGDAAAGDELERLTGKRQVPVLVHDGQPMPESAKIIEHLRIATVGF